MSKRGRSRSKSTYYSQAGEQYVDTKSKQLLFHQAAVCTLGRTRLEAQEQFRESEAEKLLLQHSKKRKSHGFVLCLVDRIRFQKNKNTASKSYRKDLPYREIKHFYQFKAMPDIFTLCVEEETTGNRTYESFKCKKEEDVLILRNLTAKAFQDPQFLLHDAIPIRQISMSPSMSNDSRHQNGEVRLNTISVVSANPNRNSTIYHSSYENQSSPLFIKPTHRQISPPSRHSPEDFYRYRGRPVSIERQIDRKERSVTLGPTSTRNSSHWTEDITYLISDNEHGPQLTDYGPIYMYVSRVQHTDNDYHTENHSPVFIRNRNSYR